MKTGRLVAVVLASIAFSACSTQAPIAPDTATAAVGGPAAGAARGTPGTYTLSFVAVVDGALQEVTTLPVSSAELILRAYVADSGGQPAQAGTVTFEYCSFKRRPPNDITRADEAPKEACDQGTASWARLRSVPLDAGTCAPSEAGYACVNFGVVAIPRDVGFRFRYSPQGSGIAGGTSEATNFTWVPAA